MPYYMDKSKNRLSKIPKLLGTISIAVITAFASSSLILNISSNIHPLKSLYYVQGAATAAYIISCIVFLFILPFKANQKARLLFILGSVGCMIAPLLVVTPIGSRCFFCPLCNDGLSCNGALPAI